jgi:hypothetical protein
VGIAFALLVPIYAATLAVVPLSAAAPAMTADQQLVAGLRTATTEGHAALAALANPTPARSSQARQSLARDVKALAAAKGAAPRAVGALDIPSVQVALVQARSLARGAIADVAGRKYAAARTAIRAELRLTAQALSDFGVPLRRDFAAFVVNRRYDNLPQFTDYSGLSAKVGVDVSKVVVGAADRRTANAGERRGAAIETDGLPIDRMSVYVISDPIGSFRSGWCNLHAGLITCKLRQAMTADDIFTIAFAPKLPPGTELLVKFWSSDGRQSYAPLIAK